MTRAELTTDSYDHRVLFRRAFTLDRLPASAPVRITADSRYVLWVNGVEVLRGPARSHPSRLLFDVADVAPHLRAGRNVVSVLARFYGHPTAWWLPAVPTFSHGGGALVAELDLPDGALLTGDSWRCCEADAWEPQTPQGTGQFIPEVLDGRRLDAGWLSPDFDDTGWDRARVVTAIHVGGSSRRQPPADPYGPLNRSRPVSMAPPRWRGPARATLRRGPVPVEADPVSYPADSLQGAGPADDVAFPVRLDVRAGEVAVLTADFGEVVAGTPSFAVDAPAGTRFDLRLLEELDGDGRPSAHNHAHGVRYIARGAGDHFEAADPSGGRHAVLAITGAGAVAVSRLGVVERLRQRPAGPYFTCSDADLERIHEVGLRTVDLTAQDAYIDCPTREQRAWTGDSVVHQAVDFLTNPDWSLAVWHPQLAASARPDGMLSMAVVCDFERGSTYIPDWALHWIRSVFNIYRWAGDADVVASLLPVAENVLRWFEQFETGGLLKDVTGWVLLDWASVQGFQTSAVLNGLWGRALCDFAAMAAWLGDGGRARWARGQHRRLRSAFQAFWDDARGAYCDGWRAGVSAPQFSDHATSAAAVGGLVPARRRAAALAFLLGRDNRVRKSWAFGKMPLFAAMGPPLPDWDTETEVVEAEPFFRYVVHDAVAILGGQDAVADLCRDWVRLFGDGRGTWPETWAGGSPCHGWSATPTRDLPLYTLGVSPELPGFAAARVAPRPGRLSTVAGAVPTPAGLLEVCIEPDVVTVRSPVPFVFDMNGTSERVAAGTSSFRRTRPSLARSGAGGGLSTRATGPLTGGV
jgi:hypothetical protein